MSFAVVTEVFTTPSEDGSKNPNNIQIHQKLFLIFFHLKKGQLWFACDYVPFNCPIPKTLVPKIMTPLHEAGLSRIGWVWLHGFCVIVISPARHDHYFASPPLGSWPPISTWHPVLFSPSWSYGHHHFALLERSNLLSKKTRVFLFLFRIPQTSPPISSPTPSGQS